MFNPLATKFSTSEVIPRALHKFQWSLQVWLARRFMKRLTVEKVAVLAHVTGLPAESIVAIHPSCRRRNQLARIAA